MRSRMIKWLGRSAFAVLVGGAMLAAGPGNALAEDRCTEPEQLGTCPPFTYLTCGPACIYEGYPEGGDCIAFCCTCII